MNGDAKRCLLFFSLSHVQYVHVLHAIVRKPVNNYTHTICLYRPIRLFIFRRRSFAFIQSMYICMSGRLFGMQVSQPTPSQQYSFDKQQRLLLLNALTGRRPQFDLYTAFTTVSIFAVDSLLVATSAAVYKAYIKPFLCV